MYSVFVCATTAFVPADNAFALKKKRLRFINAFVVVARIVVVVAAVAVVAAAVVAVVVAAAVVV